MRKNEGSEWEIEQPVLITQAIELLNDQITLNSLAEELSVMPPELRDMLSNCVQQETLNKIDRRNETDTENIVQLRKN